MSDATTTATAATAAQATPAATTAAVAATTAATPWHDGKIDADTLGFWQTKGVDAADPVKAALKLTEIYRGAEKLIGVKPEELIRLPQPNAAEADVKTFLGRLGVPAEAKDYDLSAVKFTDGRELDQNFVDMVRAGLHEARVPKDRAASFLARMIKYEESQDTAEAAERTAYVNEQVAALKKDWGANYPANELTAKAFLEKLGQKAGMTPEQTNKAWDAISKQGGVDTALAMRMLFAGGVATGEARYITPPNGLGGDNAMLSREAARQELDALKRDTAFAQRLLNNDREANRRWTDLQKVAFAPAQAA